MSIGNRIDEAIIKLSTNDLENALVQISIAIDATSSKKFPREKKVGKRVMRFIDAYEDLITHFWMGGKLIVAGPSPTVFGDKGTLGKVLYKSIRCALLHEGDISNQVSFKSGLIMGMDEGKFVVTDNLLWGLVLVLIGDETNIDKTLKGNHRIINNGVEFDLNNCWGKIDQIKHKVGYKSLQDLGLK